MYRTILLILCLAAAGCLAADDSYIVRTTDGLEITFNTNGRVVGVRDAGKQLPLRGAPGGLLMDVYEPGEFPEVDLLKNGGFEQVEEAGRLTEWNVGRGWFRIPAGGRNESAGVRITSDPKKKSTNGRLTSPSFPVKPGRSYRVSLWARTDASALGGHVPVFIVPVNAKAQRTMRVTAETVLPIGGVTSRWRRYEKVIEFPVGTTAFHIFIQPSDKGGTFIFDDVRITERPRIQAKTPVLCRVRRKGKSLVLESPPRDDAPHLQAVVTPKGERIVVDVTVEGPTNRDWPMLAAFSLPVNLLGWRWHRDINTAAVMNDTEVHQDTSHWQTFRMSRNPFACVTRPDHGLCLGQIIDPPRLFTLSAQRGRELRIDYRFGLTSQTRRFPGKATFHLELFRSDPAWGMRSAWKKYYRFHPRNFTGRTKAEGIWYVAEHMFIPHPEDYGMMFHWVLGSDTTGLEYDRDHGILNCKYTEPLGAWIGFRFATPGAKKMYQAGSYNEAVRLLAEARGQPPTLMGFEPHALGRLPIRAWADVIQRCALKNAEGRYYLERAYGNQNFGLDPSPTLPAPNRFDISWTYEIEEVVRIAESRKCRLRGVATDSVSRWWAGRYSVRAEHLADAHHPPVFLESDGRLVLFSGFEFVEWLKRMRGKIDERDMILIGNYVRYTQTLYHPWYDMMGASEDHVLEDAPSFPYQRAMSYHKPLSVITENLVKGKPNTPRKHEIMHALLPYAIWPGAKFRKWRDPEPYRAMYKQYIPIFRTLAEAKWEPIPHAKVDPPGVLCERFGPTPEGDVYFTLYNPAHIEKPIQFEFNTGALGFSKTKKILCRELIEKTDKTVRNNTVSLTIPARRCRIIRLK